MDSENLNNTQGQKSWPAGIDEQIDESLELLNLFQGEPEVDRASQVLKQSRLSKALDRPKSQTKCSTAFQLTLNEVEKWKDLKLYLFGLKNFQYAIACEEKAPTTEHPHIHCYLQLSRSMRLSIKKLMGAHVEKCYGSPQQNIDYIYKRGKFINKKHSPEDEAKIIWEEGEMKEKGGCQTIKELKECPEEDLDDNNVFLYNIINKERERRKCSITEETFYSPKHIFYIHGESGSGKTCLATWLMKQLGLTRFENIKREGEFYHGLKGVENTALYDDFRDSHMKPSEFINLIDYNKHTMNIKGGSVVNEFQYIFITSVFSPRSLWENMDKRDESEIQWLRRINYCIYVSPDHMAYLQDTKSGETIKKYESFKIYMDSLLKTKNINNLLDNIN